MSVPVSLLVAMLDCNLFSFSIFDFLAATSSVSDTLKQKYELHGNIYVMDLTLNIVNSIISYQNIKRYTGKVK